MASQVMAVGIRQVLLLRESVRTLAALQPPHPRQVDGSDSNWSEHSSQVTLRPYTSGSSSHATIELLMLFFCKRRCWYTNPC